MERMGQTVTLMGLPENAREVGQSFTFAVLWDLYGVTQVVMEDEAMWEAFKELNKGSTIQITGVVRRRDSKNPKLPTDDIEMIPEAVEVLGRCRHNGLPFQIDRSRKVDESARLKYRCLDLHNPGVKNNIIPRCQVVAALRKAMLDHGFLEITTPVLTASSPEGARGYLVSNCKHPGKFYALSQAPQQFKQLLTASSFNKYSRTAPCFQDEDARDDRSPDGFYQLDMEMAFAGQEDTFAVLEDVLPLTFTRYDTYNMASITPFRRISYREVMDKYGSDEPGLHIDLVVTDATEVPSACDFGPFERNTVKAVVAIGSEDTCRQIDKLCVDVEVQSSEKACWFHYDENGEIVGDTVKSVQSMKDVVIAVLGLGKGRFMGLTAGKLLTAQEIVGVLRPKLGAFCPNHMDKKRYEFCWIVDLPTCEIGGKSGLLEFCRSPFSIPNGGLEILKETVVDEVGPLSVTAFQYNLVCNSVELSSGAMWNYDPKIMIEAFQLVRLSEDDVKAGLPAMYSAPTYGAPPHTSITLGVDRMIVLLAGEGSIREITPFPINKSTQDLMMGALSFVTRARLDELDIIYAKKKGDEAAR